MSTGDTRTADGTAMKGLRTDNVGSLLRPGRLQQAFDDHRAGRLDDAALRTAQDDEIHRVVRLQEEHGLPVVTDGEFRRRHFNESFADVAGFAGDCLAPARPSRPENAAAPGAASAEQVTTVRLETVRPLELVRNRPRDEYEFTQALTNRPVKATLLNPDGVAQRLDAAASREVYDSVEAFLDDVISIEREIISGLREAGCRYMQIDAPRYSSYLGESSREAMRRSGRDPQRALELGIAAENAVIADFPDMTFGLHICRGNRRSQWHFDGPYDDIAEQLEWLQHDRLLLEYDTDRSGGFEPLRHVAEGTVVVLGLITTKTGELESADTIKHRIEEAAQYVPIERLALSTQCGFASVIEGNLLTEDDQWRKLDLMLDVADEVWS